MRIIFEDVLEFCLLKHVSLLSIMSSDVDNGFYHILSFGSLFDVRDMFGQGVIVQKYIIFRISMIELFFLMCREAC